MVTLAGAVALGIGDEIGDFRDGKVADLVYLRPPAGSPLAAVLERGARAVRRCRRIEAKFEIRTAGECDQGDGNRELVHGRKPTVRESTSRQQTVGIRS